MTLLNWVAALVAAYVLFVALFEAGYLGAYQPSFEENGIPMLVLITTDESGTSQDGMLARFEVDDQLYESAHHWTRACYRRAVEFPDVQAGVDGLSLDVFAQT